MASQEVQASSNQTSPPLYQWIYVLLVLAKGRPWKGVADPPGQQECKVTFSHKAGSLLRPEALHNEQQDSSVSQS